MKKPEYSRFESERQPSSSNCKTFPQIKTCCFVGRAAIESEVGGYHVGPRLGCSVELYDNTSRLMPSGAGTGRESLDEQTNSPDRWPKLFAKAKNPLCCLQCFIGQAVNAGPGFSFQGLNIGPD